MIEAFDDAFLNENCSAWRRGSARLDEITADDPHAPLEMRLSFFDREPLVAATQKMLGWPCQKVIMAHGQWQPSDGHAYLNAAFDGAKAP